MSNNTNTPATTLPTAELAPLDKINQFLAHYADYTPGWHTTETELHRVLLQLSGDIHGWYSTFSTGDPLLAGWLLCAMNRGLITLAQDDDGTTVTLTPRK